MQPKPSNRMQNASMNISYTNRQVDDFTTFGQSYMIRCSGIRIFLFYCFFFFQFDNSSVVSSPLVSILRSILCCYFFFLYAYSPPYSLRSAYTWHLVVKHVFDSVGERENQFERRALTHTHTNAIRQLSCELVDKFSHIEFSLSISPSFNAHQYTLKRTAVQRWIVRPFELNSRHFDRQQRVNSVSKTKRRIQTAFQYEIHSHHRNYHHCTL